MIRSRQRSASKNGPGPDRRHWKGSAEKQIVFDVIQKEEYAKAIGIRRKPDPALPWITPSSHRDSPTVEDEQNLLDPRLKDEYALQKRWK